jgi:hypothetical protein
VLPGQRVAMDEYEAMVEWLLLRKNRTSLKRKLFQCHFVHHRSYIKSLKLNLRLQGEKTIPKH